MSFSDVADLAEYSTIYQELKAKGVTFQQVDPQKVEPYRKALVIIYDVTAFHLTVLSILIHNIMHFITLGWLISGNM